MDFPHRIINNPCGFEKYLNPRGNLLAKPSKSFRSCVRAMKAVARIVSRGTSRSTLFHSVHGVSRAAGPLAIESPASEQKTHYETPRSRRSMMKASAATPPALKEIFHVAKGINASQERL